MKKILLFTVILLLTIVSSCSKTKNEELKDVTFNNVPSSLYKGESLIIDYSKQDNVSVSWESSNPEVATVNAGTINALTAGNFTLKATFTLNEQSKNYEFNIIILETDYFITYHLDDGVQNSNNPSGYNINNLPLVLAEPTKEGFTFLGWYLNSDFSGDVVTSITVGTKNNLDLYAKWKKNPISHTITYDLDGGVLPENAPTYFIEGEGVKLDNPEKEGYDFLGWKLSKNATTYITEIDGSVTIDCTLYATWKKIPVNSKIIYHLDGGILPENAPTTYTEGTELKLPTATKEGSTFLGWTLTENSTEYITKISKTQSGEVTLYAQWKEITTFTIEYLYEDGELPTEPFTKVQDFIDYFWNAFYSWSGSSDSLESFKSSCLAKWKTGAAATYKLYNQSADQDTKDDNYFFHAKANFDLWMPVLIGFNDAVYDINSAQTVWSSAWTAHKRFYEFFSGSFASYWTDARKKMVYNAIGKPIDLPTSYEAGDEFDLVELVIYDGRTFLGWYDAKGNKVEKITSDMRGNLVLTAKWSDAILVSSFVIENEITSLAKFNSHQFVWTIGPSNATNKRVQFSSSDKSVLTVTEEGLIYGVNEGVADIVITVLGNPELSVTLTIEVFVAPFVDGSYETVSYVEPENTISLKTTLYKIDGKVLWKSNHPNIATVDENGIVTGVKIGYAEIIAYVEGNEDVNLSFGITVISLAESEFFKLIVESHNEEVYFVKNLNVAFGAYYTDVVCSVSDLYFNHSLSVDQSLMLSQEILTETKRTEKMSSIEFITVHYNGMPQKDVDGKRTATSLKNNYKVGNTTCWHYSTGNDGVYQSLDDYVRAAHAGDGTTAVGWTNSGVKATSNTKPTYGRSNGYLTINGEKSKIALPSGFENARFTWYGPAWKVVDGYYYIAKLYYNTDYKYISNYGGNKNSIGIETACNVNSDLWKTYHITAQLVASLLQKHNLDLTRVTGHHMFSGKDCPQTLLENDGELWYKFMDLVEAEYKLLQQMSNYTITMKSNNPEILDNNGRIINVPNQTTTVSYTVTVANNTTGVSKTATFSSIVHGMYTK